MSNDIDKKIAKLKDKIWELQLKKKKLNNTSSSRFGTPGFIHKGGKGWYGSNRG